MKTGQCRFSFRLGSKCEWAVFVIAGGKLND
jgi:hypothetical protein